MGDPELTAVRRPFEAAFFRMSQAVEVDHLRDELSNMLHHMYRLSELCRRRWQVDPYGFNAKVVNVAPGALGAIWIRSYDTHEIAEVWTPSDSFSDVYTDMYLVAGWKPLAAMPFVNKPAPSSPLLPRYQAYQQLENKPVLDTMRQAFDGLATLL